LYLVHQKHLFSILMYGPGDDRGNLPSMTIDTF
jgi:hypothetical protein